MASQAPAAAPKKSLWLDWAQGGLASCFAVTFTNPMELVKTRLQLQGELARKGAFVKHYNGIGHGLLVIAKSEGPPSLSLSLLGYLVSRIMAGLVALQKGLTTAYLYQLAMNGTRLGLYDYLKRGVSAASPDLEKNFAVNVVLGVFNC